MHHRMREVHQFTSVDHSYLSPPYSPDIPRRVSTSAADGASAELNVITSRCCLFGIQIRLFSRIYCLHIQALAACPRHSQRPFSAPQQPSHQSSMTHLQLQRPIKCPRICPSLHSPTIVVGFFHLTSRTCQRGLKPKSDFIAKSHRLRQDSLGLAPQV